jgi:hypothetical protein
MIFYKRGFIKFIAVLAMTQSAYQTSAAAGACVKAGNTPCLITSGGTYSGTWVSNDSASPAIIVRTTEPVILENCSITSKGDLITTEAAANLTIRNCLGYAQNSGRSGVPNGRFLLAVKLGSLSATNNYMYGVSYGFQIGPYLAADSFRLTGPIYIKYNKAINLNGLPSNGLGGYTLNGIRTECGMQDNCNHFLIMSFMNGISTPVDVSWNMVQNDPGTSSVDDVINMYSTSGTANNHIRVHDNLIVGGYAAEPVAAIYAGGGITLDGSPADTALTSTAFVDVENNRIIAHSGNGINLVAGHDNTARNNWIISVGKYPLSNPAQWFMGWAGVDVENNYGQAPSTYFNNVAVDNFSGVQLSWPKSPGDMHSAFDGVATRSDLHINNDACNTDGYIPAPNERRCGNTLLATGNVSPSDSIAFSQEQQAVADWKAAVAAQSLVIGPTKVVGTVTNGSCGKSNGLKFVFKPTANLCASGAPSSVSGTGTGTGPWFWSCAGGNTGVTVPCLANH